MKPKRIILIRHGESEGNIDGRIFERIPDHQTALTDQGKRQARDTGQTLAKIIGSESIQFYVSPSKRSWETYEELHKVFYQNRIVVYEEPRIREQDFGNFQNYEEVQRQLDERRQFGRFFYRFPNGESGADVYDRVSIFLESMFRAFQRADFPENVLIISHGLTIRLFLTRWFHWRVKYFEALANPGNCEYFILDQQPGQGYRLITPMRTKYPVDLENNASDDLFEISE
jgi:broad specificity phosphatase PhoE